MTVSAQNPRNTYTGDGISTTAFYTFYIAKNEQLEVFVDGVLQIEQTQYTIDGVGNQNGGSVYFITAPTDQVPVVFQRALVVSREIDYIQGGQLNAETLDTDIDSVVLMIQDLSSVSPSISGDNSIDMGGARVVNVADPIDDQDVATKIWTLTELGTGPADAANSAAAALVSETNAAASEDKAEKWAEEDEDTEVEPGRYSAKHWAIKSEQEANVVTSVNGNIGDVVLEASQVGALSIMGGELSTTTNTTLSFRTLDGATQPDFLPYIRSSHSAPFGELIDFGIQTQGGMRVYPNGAHAHEQGQTELWHASASKVEKVAETNAFGLSIPHNDATLSTVTVGADSAIDQAIGGGPSTGSALFAYSQAFNVAGVWQGDENGNIEKVFWFANPNAGLALCYNDVIRLQTTARGAQITGQLVILNESPDDVDLLVRQQAGSTTDIQQWQRSDGALLGKMDYRGYMYAVHYVVLTAKAVYQDDPLTLGTEVLKLLDTRVQKHAPSGPPTLVVKVDDLINHLPDVVEAVGTDDEAIDAIQLIPILINAIKELDARVTALEP